MTRDPLRVVLQRRAGLEIATIDAWWRTNRSSSPDGFLSELEAVLQALALLPNLGPPARSTRIEGARRVLLAKTQHYVYYREVGDTIQVLAVWHTSRGTSPGL